MIRICLFILSVTLTTFLYGEDTIIHSKNYRKFEKYIQQQEGMASIDTVLVQKDSLLIQYHVSQPTFFTIQSTVPPSFSTSIFDPKIIDTCKKYTYRQLQTITQSIIGKAENQGYPFAKVHWVTDTVIVTHLQTLFRVTLSVDIGHRITMDTVIQQENIVLRNYIVRQQLKIKKGTLYEEKKIRKIDNYFSQLPYVKIIRPLEVEFLQYKATPYLYLQKKNNNKVNVLLSFSQNDKGKFLLQGEGNLELSNVFKGGESLRLNYTYFENKQQHFFGNIALPYLLFGIAGTSVNLSITKRDTLYFNLTTDWSLYYTFDFLGRAGVFYRYEKNNDIAKKTNTSTNLYGISLTWNEQERLLFLNKDYALKIVLGTGTRQELETQQKYQQLMAEIQTGVVIPVYNSIQCLLRAEGKFKYIINNPLPLSEGELHYIGGIHSIRGFSEQSLPAQSYGMASIEPFWQVNLLKLSMFYDFAYTYHSQHQFFHGYGIGGRLLMKNNELTLYLALGSPVTSPPVFSTIKLHIGYNFIF